jgi:hypothetical protein
MSQQQEIREMISNVSGSENEQTLQYILDSVGLKTDLSLVPFQQVPPTFRAAMSTLLDSTVSGLTVDKIRDITAEVKARSAALESIVTAETILQGLKKLDNDVIEFTLPVGTTIQEAGKILNTAAREKGMEHPVFYESDAKFWETNEANDDLRTKPGETYRFKISIDSVSKTRAKQIEDYGEGAPLGAVAIAEVCQRLKEGNDTSLFIDDSDGNKVWVRGLTPGIVLASTPDRGVDVGGTRDDVGSYTVAFAFSIPDQN